MIIGADTLADIFNWYRSTDVFRLCSFVAMKRPGCDEMLFRQNLQKAAQAGAAVCVADIPQIDISSTQIREAVAAEEEIGDFVPASVCEYIRQKNLYRPCKMHFTKIYEDVKQLLSLKRFTHSIGVMEESARLGKIFGADPEKCRLAGLLHDCAKELTKQQYKWLGIKILECGDYDGKQVLLHGEAGAILARVCVMALRIPRFLKQSAAISLANPKWVCLRKSFLWQITRNQDGAVRSLTWYAKS